ncbi:hypothetical protein V8F33_013281 [Rhypophila sp. PSN 637]
MALVTMTATANPEPFVHFTEFIAETRNKYKGRDIAGNEHQYVPWSELAQYWTPTRIRLVLHAFESRIDVDVTVIQETLPPYFLHTCLYWSPSRPKLQHNLCQTRPS